MSQPALVNVFRLLTQSIIKFWILSRTFRLLLCGFQFAQLIVHYLKISRGKFPRLIFSCPVPSGLPHGSHCVPINMNRLIPVIFFRNPQLFMALNFCRFFKTHTLTHTGGRKVPDRARQEFSCLALFFYRICWLMTPPMVSAASCLIWAVA